MSECAVCYVSDLNFLMPTLVSAAGLRSFVPVHKAGIFIFLIDEDAARIDTLNRALAPRGIHVLPMQSKNFSGFDREKFNKTHVPIATLGRFFMDEMLPASCTRIVYIDGDTWIRRDPSPLLDAIVPEGRFAAAEDISSFCRDDATPYGRTVRAYFKDIGLGSRGYFNAGVFAVSRATWRSLAPEAYKFFVDNTHLCRYHDQSALNAVIGDRRLRLSLKWNFQTPYTYWGVEQGTDPVIYHTTEGGKPWLGKCGPWKKLYEAYKTARAPFDPLQLPARQFDARARKQTDLLHLKQKLMLRTLLLPRLLSRRAAFATMEKDAWI